MMDIHETVQGLMMNAKDVHGWATAVREFGPTLGNDSMRRAAKRRSNVESTWNSCVCA